MTEQIPTWLAVPLIVGGILAVTWQRRAALRDWLGL